MPELPPATASQRLITQAVPKRLAVRFRTRDQEDQGVVFTPVFTIDNLTVAPELVASAEEQTILGYRVTASPTVRHIIETTRGRPLRLEKGKAAEYADLLFDRGIPVVSESGKLVGKGRAARVELDLTLLSGDRLQVRSRLTLDDGTVLPKPKDIREVLDDAGWMPFGKEMVKLGLTATRLDNVLFEEGGDGILEGALVPQFLKKLQGNGLLGAHARRDDTLRTMAVVAGSATPTLEVTGDAAAMRVEPCLRIALPNGEVVRRADEELMTVPVESHVYMRYDGGWIDVDGETVVGYRTARQQLPIPVGDITGQAIPEAMVGLRKAFGNPWIVTVSPDVAQAHKVIDDQPAIRFTLQPRAEGGVLSYGLLPSYAYHGLAVDHAETKAALARSSPWLRRDRCWIKPCRKAFDAVEELSRIEHLAEGAGGFSLPAHRLEAIQQAASRLGSVTVSHDAGVAAHIALDLRLAEADAVEVVALMRLDDGRERPAPADMDQVRRRDGWYADGDELVRVSLVDPALDALFTVGGRTTLHGSSVPLMLQAIEDNADSLGQVRKDDALATLAVKPVATSHRLRMRGDREVVRIESSMILSPPVGDSVEMPCAALAEARIAETDFIRVPWGWARLEAGALDRFHAARRTVQQQCPLDTPLHGHRIPDAVMALHRLVRTGQTGGPWRIDVAREVAAIHYTTDTPGTPEFVLRVDVEDGLPNASLAVSYRHDDSIIPHAAVAAAVAAGSVWVRYDDRWSALDHEAFNAVVEACENLGLYDVGASFHVPLNVLEAAEKKLAAIGPVVRIPDRFPEVLLDVHVSVLDESIVVSSKLVCEDGREIAKPLSLEDLAHDAGLLADGETVVRCNLADRPLERTLLARSGPATVVDEDIPNLLRDISRPIPGVGRITRDEACAALEFIDGSLMPMIVVTGDAEGITVDLGYEARSASGGSRPLDGVQFDKALETGATFVRVANGWVPIDPVVIEVMADSRAALARRIRLGARLQGGDIPAALEILDSPKVAGWKTVIPERLQALHRRLHVRGLPELEVVSLPGAKRPEVVVRPSYRADGVVVSHEDASSAIRDHGGWHRAPDCWLKLDPTVVVTVEDTMAQLGCRASPAGFLVPPDARPLPAASLASAGRLRILNTATLGGGLEIVFTLTADDRLKAAFRVLLDDGTVVVPPVPLEELLADQGLMCHGGSLVEVSLPPDAPYDQLVEATKATGLSGLDVPMFLEAFEPHVGRFRNVVFQGQLARVTVRVVQVAKQLTLSGDGDHLVVSPEMAVVDPQGRHTTEVFSVGEVRAGTRSGRVYKRTRTGWLAVAESDVSYFNAFVDAVADLVPLGERCEGIDIPRVLMTLAPSSKRVWKLRNQFGIPEIDIPVAVSDRHRVIDTLAETTCVLETVSLDGRPSCTLLPIYRHGTVELPHEQVRCCIEAGEELARTPAGWVVIDAAAFRRVNKLAEKLDLDPIEGGYRVPMRERERVRSAMRHIGSVTDSPAELTAAEVLVDLSLDDENTLHVGTRLSTPEGGVIPRPPSIRTVVEDDCCMSVGERVVSIPAAETALVFELLDQSEPITLSGQDVPRFLKRISQIDENGLRVQRDGRLASTRIIEGVSRGVLKVSTHPTGVQLEPMIQLESPGDSVIDVADEWVMAIPTANDADAPHGYARIDGGWAEIHRDAIRRYRTARTTLARALPRGLRVEGADVPQTLIMLDAIAKDPKVAGPWSIDIGEDVHEKHRLCDGAAHVTFTMDIIDSDGLSLLYLDPAYNHERFRLSHREVADLAASDTAWVRRGVNWIRVDTDAFDRVERRLSELDLERHRDGYAFPATARDKVLPVFSEIGTVEYTQAYSDFIGKLADFTCIEEVPLPASLRRDVVLRAYQQHGYNWLAFLQRFGLNGILADDMGLGKTLQTLAVVERAREITRSDKPVLIVCPTSVVHNWQKEIERFLIDRKVVVFQGTTRDRSARIIDAMAYGQRRAGPNTYVVTSYEIALREAGRLSEVPWLYVVCDEGHHIKNPSAKRSQVVKRIAGQHKLVLTGTPIQNQLVELWSLFDFAMPGYLGTQAEFTKKYCAGGGGAAWQSLRDDLTARIRPFVLRRLKKDVAKDLPEKLIIHHEVELTPIQVELYKAFLDSTECRRLLSDIDREGVARSQMHIFAIIKKLQSICNHPILIKDDWHPDHAKAEDSAKLDFLKELLEEVREGGHRALLFCRSIDMHMILKRCLADWRYRYLHLCGDTPTSERQRLVDTFNSTPEITVFLLSMAGNTGINLTGADTVIFYDHDWNPANDNQAMDRAYRIGQTKTVTVYRLVSKGTIEERILERQRVKQTLADEVIGSDAAGFKDLSREEVLALFRLDE